MMKNTILFLLLFLFTSGLVSQNVKTWGDQDNGTYINPILNADYSDPDVIRVGNKYYMVCSDFHYIGMPVLESDDMINWKIISQVYDKFNFPEWNENKRFAGGSWAPSIRFHDNKYWIYFCTPNEGLFMSYASDPRGPWSPLHILKAVDKWEDPCPLWDDDGQAYLGRSQWGAGPIIIHKMSSDGKTLLDEGKTVYTGPVAEGTKFYKKDGFYYISIPEGGVEVGWQTILRSKNIYGPYEKKVVLETGSTDINGPHQGALVETPEGELWFYHFQFTQPLGRVLHLQPAHWSNGWPVIGVDIDMNGIGEPVKTWTKPNVGNTFKIVIPQTSDEFSTEKLGLQWQFNHNPHNEGWALNKVKGKLTIKALQSGDMKNSHNMITQKTMGYLSEVVTKMDFDKITEGHHSGLLCSGNIFNGVGVLRENGINYIYLELNGECKKFDQIKSTTIYLKATLDNIKNSHQLYYSLNNKDYMPLGDPYSLKFGSWKGSRIGLYSYNLHSDSGEASFDWFRYECDGPITK